MGCSASVIQIPDITAVPPGPEVAVTNLNFSQNVSRADLQASIKMGQQKGRKAEDLIVKSSARTRNRARRSTRFF